MIKGLYIHIPFCSEKCPYCDFMSVSIQGADIYRRYIEALKKEILLYKNEDFYLESVYFGGGTPSLLPPELLGEVILFIKRHIPCSKNMEITVEVNPETYRYPHFLKIKEYGVNRISIGAQTFNSRLLKILGRHHTPEDTFKTVEGALKAGIQNINLDMIYGIYTQTLKDLEEDLKTFVSLPVKHISGYMLTAYEGTPLGSMVKSGSFKLPDETTVEKMFFLINDTLEENGFKRYEISNWAKEGFLCRHNYFYWNHTDFLGIGVSAWSFVNKRRFGNVSNLDVYLEKVFKNQKPIFFEEKLSEEDIFKEKVILGLRTTEGVDETFIKNKENLKKLIDEGFLKKKKGKVSLSEKGVLISNYIINMLI